MVTTFQEHAKMLKVAPDAKERCWINVITPTHTELQRLERTFGIPMEFLTAALDPDERARVESEDGFQLILIRIPVRDEETEIPYYTHPLAIILGESIAVTVCTIESSVISDFIETKIKNFSIESHSRFVLQIFYRTALKYLKFLKEIERETTAIEQLLHTSLQNEELLRLLRYEKSLVYFTTSLRS
ncbi:MAG: magnesium transporter CorA family protein, partial [Bacteroidia bacterium]|nr:magnesium transporter CorA family protein [Bacteroidia bacterium]